uniref:Putative odorant-binding protein OBPjj10 n=1 Tax=Anopheles gambiae TaxID=7165 RepID=Q6H901_ANOGA|nr:putative odorant-binding protein OBPjj10 [Anopheles gambiae]
MKCSETIVTFAVVLTLLACTVTGAKVRFATGSRVQSKNFKLYSSLSFFPPPCRVPGWRLSTSGASIRMHASARKRAYCPRTRSACAETFPSTRRRRGALCMHSEGAGKARLSKEFFGLVMVCFVKCFLDKAGFIDDDGVIQQDVIREKLTVGIEAGKVNELIKKCSVEGTDACDTAYQMYKCFFSNHKVPKELFQMRKGIGRRNMQQ